MSEKDQDRRLTRQAVRDLADSSGDSGRRRLSDRHSPSQPDHLKRCYLCQSSAEYEAARTKRPSRSRTHSTASSRSASSPKPPSRSSTPTYIDISEDLSDCAVPHQSISAEPSIRKEKIISHNLQCGALIPDETSSDIDIKPVIEFDQDTELSDTELGGISETSATKVGNVTTGESTLLLATTAVTKPTSVSTSILLSQTEEAPTVTLASTTKIPVVATPPKPLLSQVPLPPERPSRPSVQNPLTHPSAQIPKPHVMSSGGPLTRMQAQNTGAQDGGHRQISATNIEESTLDQCFQITPKWHYIKSNHEETSHWLDSANFESVLLELLYFAHDQGQVQQKEMEGQFEKELERAIDSIEKLECLDAFCKTFIREGRFRPTGKVAVSSSGKDEKHNRLFRMINADLQNLQRQHRILSMVCTGTADHEVHTQAQRENLRKLVEDLVHVVHPGDRGTYSEVYKVITENAVVDQRMIKPQLTSLKVVSHPDIVVAFGGPILAGGSQIRCDALEHKIRAKLPSLLIKMHFSDRIQDQKWPDLNKADDSGIASTLDGTLGTDDPSLPSGSSTPTGTGSSRSKSKEKAEEKSSTAKTGTSSSSSRSGKRKQAEEATPPKSKRHREDITASGYDSQPPDAHVINEIYSEHVAQLLCSLAQSPLGYVKHCKYTVAPNDERDGTASVSILGMIVSGEDIYLTKLDATHDYLDSLVETFRMDQLSFSCMANPLNLYKGTHLKALLMFLRYTCLNFPRTTYFMSD